MNGDLAEQGGLTRGLPGGNRTGGVITRQATLTEMILDGSFSSSRRRRNDVPEWRL